MMSIGQNKAEWKKEYGDLLASVYFSRPCIFISHKKEDSDTAIKIGDFIMNHGIDIYLDLYDCVLQEAAGYDNDKSIVDSVKRGLKASTHLLCIISDKTKLSWWVPYEIGMADEKGLIISSLKLKNVEDIPSFLKIQEALCTARDFHNYIQSMTTGIQNVFSHDDHALLEQYIDA